MGKIPEENRGDAIRECQLCHQKVKKLLEHHYPIPKELLGGVETKFVCPRCHGKDHRRYPKELIQRLIDEIEGRRMTEFDMFGEDPHAERKKLIQEAKRRLDRNRGQPPATGGDIWVGR